jgi:DNA ligase-1
MKPMLAPAIVDVNKLQFPLIASPKIDGIRCLIVNTQPMSRSMKPIPNVYIRQTLSMPGFDGTDGELIIPQYNFNQIQSEVMSFEGKPNFEYHVFDLHNQSSVFTERHKALCNLVKRIDLPYIKIVPQIVINNLEELLAYEKECLEAKYEGVMLRHPDSPYKYGRSTLNQAYLLKLKRFHDAEATIVGFTERMSNQNESFTNALGHTERSSAKEGLVPDNTLGSLQVETENGVDFDVGSGFTQSERDDLWNKKETLVGQLIKFKYQEIIEETGRPRFPVFLGFRHIEDT